jgi:predicted transcriptional regulator
VKPGSINELELTRPFRLVTFDHDPATFVVDLRNPVSRGIVLSDSDSSAPKELSRSEWKVMRIVWSIQKAMAREVYTVAGEQFNWSPATVKTLLRRLVDKGYLQTTQVGNGFVYRPSRTAIASLRSAADTLLSNAIDGTTGPLLQHMVKSSSLSRDDLQELQQLIEAKKSQLSRSTDQNAAGRKKEPNTRKKKGTR